MENHLDFIVIKAEPKFRADSFVLDEADCSAAPVETGIVSVTLSLYACDKRDTAARHAWDNFGVVTEMVPLGLLSGFLLLSQAYEDADVLIDDCRAQSGCTGCRRDPPARNDLSHAPRLSAGACLSAGRPRRPADAAR